MNFRSTMPQIVCTSSPNLRYKGKQICATKILKIPNKIKYWKWSIIFLAPTSFAMAITEGTKLNMRMPCTTRRRPFQAYGVATQYIIESCPRHSVVVRLSRKAMPRNVWPNRELHKHVGVTCTRALWEHCDWKFARPWCRGKNKNKKCACAEFIICFRTAKTCKLKKTIGKQKQQEIMCT